MRICSVMQKIGVYAVYKRNFVRLKISAEFLVEEVFALLAIFLEFQQRQYHFSQNYPRISVEKQSYARFRLKFPTDRPHQGTSMISKSQGKK